MIFQLHIFLLMLLWSFSSIIETSRLVSSIIISTNSPCRLINHPQHSLPDISLGFLQFFIVILILLIIVVFVHRRRSTRQQRRRQNSGKREQYCTGNESWPGLKADEIHLSRAFLWLGGYCHILSVVGQSCDRYICSVFLLYLCNTAEKLDFTHAQVRNPLIFTMH